MPSGTGIDLTPRDHKVLFYGEDRELIAAVAGYLGAALSDGAVAIVIATDAHLSRFESALEAGGFDTAAERAAGSLLTLDAAATLEQFILDGRPDPERFEAVVGGVVREAAATGREVRAYGEMVALLWDDGDVAEAMELEAFWNTLREQVPFSLFCAYPATSVPGRSNETALTHVCRLHSGVVGRRGGPPSAKDELHVTAESSQPFAHAPSAPRAARHFVLETLADWGRGDLADDAAIVVTELVTNAMIHSQSPVVVTVSRTDSGVRLAVDDESSTIPDMRDPSAAHPSGRGLPIVATLTRSWGFQVRTRGKSVWAEFGDGPGRLNGSS